MTIPEMEKVEETGCKVIKGAGGWEKKTVLDTLNLR